MNRSKRFVRLRQRPFLLEHLQLIERFILFLLLAIVHITSSDSACHVWDG